MDKVVEGEATVGLQPDTLGGHVGKVSAIGAALHNLVRPRARKKIAAEARAETERVRRPGEGMARSPTDAGITGGLSLLLDSPNARRR